MDDCANAQYPPITAAIRSRVESGWDPWPEAREWLLGKCDTIDAIHARLEAAYDRLRAECEHDYAPESHYMMLPKDADGVPIHIGDVMEGKKIGGGYGEPFEVVGYVMSNGELEPMDEHRNPRKRKYSRHHHAPTVDDVLTELTEEVWNRCCIGTTASDSGIRELVSEYAAKLRLAGDAE